MLTGAASGIGLAAAHIFASRGAMVYALNISSPHSEGPQSPSNINHVLCDVAYLPELRAVFKRIGHIDIAVANAAVSQESDYSADSYREGGELEEPKYKILDGKEGRLSATLMSKRCFRINSDQKCDFHNFSD